VKQQLWQRGNNENKEKYVSTSVLGLQEYFINGDCDTSSSEFQPLAVIINIVITPTVKCE
jgi:hypothetical protein